MEPNGMMPDCKGLKARRISIVGSTGSGKTYLARTLSRCVNLPHHELDILRRKVTRGEQVRAEFIAAVEELVERDEWLIDGHYRDVRDLIWSRADLVVHLNYSLPLIGSRLLIRFIKKYRSRHQSARHGNDIGTPDATSASVPASARWSHRLARLVKTVRERSEYARILQGPDYKDLPVLELKSPRETDHWLASLASG